MSRFYEPVNGFTHLAGAILAAIGTLWLVFLTWHEPAQLATVLVYGVSLVIGFSASTALHLIKCRDTVRNWLTRADHAAIYIMIAGTYTPFCYNILTSDGWRWGIISVVWALAAAGALYKLFIWNRGHDHFFSTFSYVAMGWLALIIAPQIIGALSSPVLWLIIGGGVTYSVGAVIFQLRKPNFHRHFGFHELWHIFVLVASALHFIAVLLVIVK